MEELVNGVVQRTYTYGLNRISQSQLISGTWQTSFYGYDGGGNVRLLTDASGTVTDTYEYDAFGDLINSTGNTPSNYLYRGEQFDPDLGLYYLRARYYNPVTGRFLTRDPEPGDLSDPATLHKYLYVRHDPVNRIDPLGRADILEYPRVVTVPLAAATGIVALRQQIVCILQVTASVLQGVASSIGTPVSVSPDFANCTPV